MNQLKVILLLAAFLTIGFPSFAQKGIGTCERYVQKKKVEKAINCYEERLPQQPNNIKVLCRLSELYYAKNDLTKTKLYAARSVEANANEAYNPLFYLARKMSFKRDNTTAVYILDLLANRVSDNQKKEKLRALKSSYLLQKYELSQPRYNVILENLGDSINSTDAEYLPSLSLDGNTMVFTRKINGANEDFFIAHKDSNGYWLKAKNLGYPPNTGYPDGAAKLSADGNYLFFTRCDMRSTNGMERGGCDLVFCYRTGFENNAIKWSAPQYFKFTINTVAYEGQPCISSDNKDLYFVSDREGGLGGKDIYVSHFKNNFWTEPENLGPQINTPGDETTPFIHPDNETLYFASNGHPTLGKADVFLSRKIDKNNWQKAVNLGAPINSDQKDGGVAITAKGDVGYIASQRAGSRGSLDIYRFDLYEGIKPIPTICMKGQVLNKKTQALFKEVPVYFYKWPSLEQVSKVYSNKGDASYTQALHMGKQYLVHIDQQGYRPYYNLVDLRKDTFPSNVLKNIRLREPHIIDTLCSLTLKLDSNNQLTQNSREAWQQVKQSIPNWLEDSAQVKLYIKSYYYYGDSDTDRNAYAYFKQRFDQVNQLREEMIEFGFPETKSILLTKPFIWRDEAEDLKRIELKFVEFY